MTGSLGTARAGHTATLLNSGKVLIAGGEDATGKSLTSAELYDPTAGTFAATGGLGEPLAFHSAILIASGKVLIAGGDINSSTPSADAALYDPVAGTFTAVGMMSVARDFFVSGLFATGPHSGKVIVAGGNRFAATATADLFDPTTDTFTATGSMTYARVAGIGVVLNSGKFLAAGGGGVSDGDYGASSELYNPTTGTFGSIATTSGLTAAHTYGNGVLLANGLVAILGGTILPSGNLTNITNIYDPSSDGYLPGIGPLLNSPRFKAAASLLNNGQVLVTGGVTAGDVYTTVAELLQ